MTTKGESKIKEITILKTAEGVEVGKENEKEQAGGINPQVLQLITIEIDLKNDEAVDMLNQIKRQC